MTTIEGEDTSPKGVADLQVVVENIRGRREAVLDGSVIMPSTIPNFPSVRQSLVSCDDEEVQTYRIEITTDNVVKQQSVPARFSSSEKEEYLAEFDIVDTRGEFIPPPAPMTPRRRTFKMQQQVSETAQEQQLKMKGGGVFSSLMLNRTYSLEDSKDGVEVKMPAGLPVAKANDVVTPRKEKMTVRDIVGAPPVAAAKTIVTVRTATPPQKKGIFSSLRNRTYSLEDSKHGIEKREPGSSSLKTDSNDQAAVAVSAATAPPVEATQTTRQVHGPVDLDAEEENNDEGDSLSMQSSASSQKQKKDETVNNSNSAPVEPVASAQEAKSVPAGAKPATETKSSSVVITPPALTKSSPAVIPPPLPTKLPETSPTLLAIDTSTKVTDEEPNPAESIEVEAPDTLKPKSTKQDDDTKSTASSSTEAIMATKPRDKFYGEAAVERILEGFFDQVTCTCFSNQCVGKEPDEREVPDYMVVEIQKIHQKAQKKRSEIVEKRQARKAKKSNKKSSPRKIKGNVTPKKSLKSKTVKSDEKEFEMEEQKKFVPTYEWGEKVSEQDSVTTASSGEPHASGVTVGQFLKKRFDLFEKSIRRGGNEGFTDESSQEIETLVEDSDVDDEDTLDNIFSDAILNIRPVERDVPSSKSATESGVVQSKRSKKGKKDNEKSPEEARVILLAPAREDGSESLPDARGADGESLLDDEESEYTTELIQVDFDPSKLGNTTDADMYLAREVLRRYAEITGISLDELIEDVVDESLASLTLDAYGFPLDRNGDDSTL